MSFEDAGKRQGKWLDLASRRVVISSLPEGFVNLGFSKGYKFCKSLRYSPFAFTQAVRPFALPPWMTAAAELGLENSVSFVKTYLSPS